MHEAIGFLHLVKRGEKVEDIRQLIGANTSQRRKTLRFFDQLCLRNGLARIRRARQPLESIESTSSSQPRVAKETSRAAHKDGRGRRFTKAEVEGIKAAILEGKRPGEIRAEFHCTLDPLLRIRRAMGVYRDRRRKPQVPDNERAKIIELLPNQSVRQICETLNLSQNRVRAIAAAAGWSAEMKAPGALGRRVRGQLKQDILASLKAGLRPADARRKFGVSLVTIRTLRRELGDTRDRRRDHKLDAVQVQEIRAALAAHSMAWRELAKKYAIGLSTVGAIHRRQKGY
jgi:hypothetical protein